MRVFVVVALLLLGVQPDSLTAQERVTLGWGRLFTNDAIGQARDRWRTGSYILSWVTGPEWSGELPPTPGLLLEFRSRGEIITPGNLTRPRPDDRRFAGVLSFGLHTHFERSGFEFASGADLVFTGPQTGAGRLQTRVHELIDIPPPNPRRVLDRQIPNGLHPTALVEVARTVPLTPRLSLRPFVEAQAGVETLIRGGVDLHIGRIGQSDLYIRDPVTGHRVAVNRARESGWAAVLGFDAAHVTSSVYLPSADGYRLTDARLRTRAGALWQTRRMSVFYGLTWLGREFEAQPEGQVLGSVQLRIRF